MRSIRRDTQFRKDVKRLFKRGKDLNKLKTIIETLVAAEVAVGSKQRPSPQGNPKDCRECHMRRTGLLIYRIEGSALCLVRTGSHADLFE